jgi:hypothetical protein
MKKQIENIAPEEKKDVGPQLSKPGSFRQKEEGDVLALILNKISVLEEKIERIEYQTKTHWVN